MGPSDDWGIPELDPAMQAEDVAIPVEQWGRIARSSRMTGTYHFYSADRTFSAVWKFPGRVPASGCAAAVEPNYSTWPEKPRAAVLWDIYRKRWLGRHWQASGARIWVDVNVWDCFRDLALLGVPRGWLSYASRKGRGTTPSDHDAEWAWCAEHAGTERIRYLVFGGDRRMREHCLARGWLWEPEPAARARKAALEPVGASGG